MPENQDNDKTRTHVALTKGTAVGHYKIIEKIGAGGMGEVYLAEDTELDRKVALKFLPSHLCQDEDCRTRFKREAQAVAKLKHPNLVTIYEVSEFQGRPFFAMEHIEGQSLRDLIGDKELRLDKVIDFAIQVCEGLSKAHQVGITHRDIKPSNIVIDADGRPKLLDFGLAAVKGMDKLTKTGSTLGTTGYMSPEQVRGEETDVRSDLFSLGVVLYEMIAGRLPFKGENEAATLHAITHDAPQPAARYRSDIPDGLQAIIDKALDKDVEMRYQTAAGVISDLKKLRRELESRVPAVQPHPSIAVLPFSNLSADPEQEYFCDGMAEEIINALTHIENLRVIARTSAFAFKGKHEDVREIGRRLDVETLLEGSVRKAGSRLRITAQLVKVADGSHLWSERYDREMEDVFGIQDEISLAIVEKLKIKLLGKEEPKIVKRYTEDLDAYNLYLKGRYFWNKRTEGGLKKGIEYFEQAIDKDPGYALAHAGLADSYSLLCSYHILPPKESIPRARTAATRAMELDDTLAEAYESLAHVRILYDWNWSNAKHEFRRAIELNPGYATAHQRYALLLTVIGQLDQAIAETRRAQELDPLSLIINTDVGLAFYIARQYDQAIEQCRNVLVMDPNFSVAHFALGLAYEQNEIYEEAVAELRKAISLSGGITVMIGALGHSYAVSGRRDKAKKVLEELRELSQRRYVSPYSIATIYVGLGDKDQAFEWLQKAYQDRSAWLIHLHLKVDPRLDSLRSDPRFTALLKKMGLE